MRAWGCSGCVCVACDASMDASGPCAVSDGGSVSVASCRDIAVAAKKGNPPEVGRSDHGMLAAVTTASSEPVFVTTPSLGLIRGVHDPAVGVDSFRGLYYAHSPSGASRWLPPRPFARAPDNHTAYDASANGPWCLQAGAEISYTKHDTFSEDCLHLNVFRPRGPSRDGRLAVMVQVHGGGFVTGGNGDALFDGSHLAAHGRVVIVSLNYRLGPRVHCETRPTTRHST
jgi:acetyl esterase/lipase